MRRLARVDANHAAVVAADGGVVRLGALEIDDRGARVVQLARQVVDRELELEEEAVIAGLCSTYDSERARAIPA